MLGSVGESSIPFSEGRQVHLCQIDDVHIVPFDGEGLFQGEGDSRADPAHPRAAGNDGDFHV